MVTILTGKKVVETETSNESTPLYMENTDAIKEKSYDINTQMIQLQNHSHPVSQLFSLCSQRKKQVIH